MPKKLPEEYNAWSLIRALKGCTSEADLREVAEGALTVLKNPNHPAYSKVLLWFTDRMDGKVPDAVQVNHTHVLEGITLMDTRDPAKPSRILDMKRMPEKQLTEHQAETELSYVQGMEFAQDHIAERMKKALSFGSPNPEGEESGEGPRDAGPPQGEGDGMLG